MSYDEFDDDIEILPGDENHPRRSAAAKARPGMMSLPSPFTCPRAGFVPDCIAHWVSY